ncbi:MAG: wax ester/triacylglycerol synthase family O-acyltransferase [Gammaproteobacteria bacterium]|jgi:WS/DGAT/MGAT family acyltransferase|nr:wax ester/triacylglycerol synthase family O-acyltransferase [Gammaproteobacteria bacterium]
MRQLSGSDAFFLYSDRPGRHQHVSTVYVYDPAPTAEGTVSFDAIRRHMEARLDASRLFRQRLVRVPFDLDYPWWIEDPHFELDFHLRHIALPEPGDWRHLCIQLSRLHTRPLDLTRPPWEMYVIEGLDSVEGLPAGAFAVMTKVHHAAIDDVTEEDFTVVLHDLEPHPSISRRKTAWRPDREPGLGELLLLSWFNNTTKILETGQSLVDRLPLVGSGQGRPRGLLRTEHGPAPVTRFDHRITPHRVWDARFFDMAEVRRIAGSFMRGTAEDVAVAVCAGAVRRYLEAKEELPAASLWGLLPLHHQERGDEGLPGHRVQLARIKLMTHVADPEDRLAGIHGEIENSRRESATEAGEMSELQDILPATTMNLAARTISANLGPGRQYRKNHNLVISITPGPDRPLHLCGARLLAYTGMATLMDDLALAHTVTSYDGRLAIAFVSDRRMMPDPAFYAECLEAAFDELCTVAAREV